MPLSWFECNKYRQNISGRDKETPEEKICQLLA